MAKVVGDLSVKAGGKDYVLHLGFRALGTLQDELGRDLAPIMSAFEEGGLPNFGVLVRVIEVALVRYHPGVGPEVADAVLAENPTCFADLLVTAFPDAAAEAGTEGAPARAGKKRRAAA